jgi:guanosine-3',5'-bis(diphosphate) 3'-pyrophosphohydrolase
MKKYTLKIGELFDLYGIRIITDSIQNCYQIFGTVHNLWQPIPGRFKDYIANPKKNGYRSLHTAVKVDKRKVVEIQIRTQEMDEFNEYGVASHWFYKTGEKPNTEELKWLKKLVEVHKQSLSPEEYYQVIRDDILKDEIYVFTPKGDSFEMPKGATAIDFAYRIHTEVGHRCIGAKANGIIIPLNRPLQNGVLVEIITGKMSIPKQSWLSFIKTANARKKIKSWLAANEKEEKIKVKKDIEEKETTILKGNKKKKALPKKSTSSLKPQVEINGEKNFLYNFAKCCKPVPKEPIIGFISRGRGIIIHKKYCYNLNHIKDFEKRTIEVNWI